jgi:CBS domain-containing protein
MLVKDLMTTKVISVKPETAISEVAELMHTNHITGVPVVNAEGRVVGTISERDFITATSGLYLPTYIKLLSSMDYVQGAKKGLPHVVKQIVNATAKDIMNQQSPFARPETTLEELAALFAEKRANPIPVTDASNNLIGIISRSDLIKFFSLKEIKKTYVPEERTSRMIDEQVNFTEGQFTSKFAYVAKARANIWITVAIVLFVVGFLAGIFYVADPNIFKK